MKETSCYLETFREYVYTPLIAQLLMVHQHGCTGVETVDGPLVFSVACSDTSGICCMHTLD